MASSVVRIAPQSRYAALCDPRPGVRSLAGLGPGCTLTLRHSARRAGVSLPRCGVVNGRQGRRCALLVCAASQGARQANPRTAALREMLASDEILKGPCCHDALSARLIERAGFDYAFMSGFCTAAARLGAPDTGLISYGEMVDQGRYIHEATESLPIIGDGDTGYGNAMNVKRTVRGYSAAGFAGILIEDQVAPKSCGHVKGKRVVGREEAISRVKAACDARDEGADILIVARTDARQAVSFDEAMARVQAFAEAGADVVFVDALASVEEMQAFADLGGAAADVPKMANMLEGGGKTPLLKPIELQDMGFKLVAYPLSVLGVAVRAMELALSGLKDGRIPSIGMMPTFEELQESVGFPEYFEEEAKYAISLPEAAASTPPPSTAGSADMDADSAPSAGAAGAAAATAAAAAAATATAAAAATAAASGSSEAAVESEEPSTPPEPPVEPEVASSSAKSESPEDVAERLAQELQDAFGDSLVEGGAVEEGVESVLMDALNRDAAEKAPREAVEADAVILPDGSATSNTRGADDATKAEPEPRTADNTALAVPYEVPKSDNPADYTLKIRISDSRTQKVKLETNLPGGWIKTVTSFIPEVSGVELESVVKAALGKEWDPSKPVVDFDSDGNRVQVWLNA